MSQGSSATGAAPTHGSQTGVETHVEQVGQSHTGHDGAATATGFPQPCPGLSLLHLFLSTVIYSIILQLLLTKGVTFHKVSYSLEQGHS